MNDCVGFLIENGELRRYTGAAADVTVPEGVTRIGAAAFAKAPWVKRVVLPEGFTFIGTAAFAGCSLLEEITLPQTLQSIGPRAFFGCERLRDPAFPAGLYGVGYEAFGGCASLTRAVLPKRLISLGDAAFAGCKSITRISLPGALFNIGAGVFKGIGPVRVSLAAGSLLTDWDRIGRAFDGCTVGRLDLPQFFKEENYDKLSTADHCVVSSDGVLQTVLRCRGDFTAPEDITAIGKKAFSKNGKLESVILPEGLTAIGEEAFLGCGRLKSIRLPSTLRSIGKEAFRECTSLESVDLPPALASLKNGVFRGCRALRRVTLPTAMESLPDETFLFCAALEEISLPDGLKKIGECAFQWCNSLERISFPAKLRYAGPHAFEGCNRLQSVSLPAALRRIDDGLFRGCVSLREIRIPTGVKDVGQGAFSGCKALERVSLPAGLKTLGERAFKECVRLQSIVLPEGCAVNGEAFSGCAGLLRAALLPGAVLGENVFSKCTALKDVSLPEGIAQIPRMTFFCCAALREVRLPESVTLIGDRAFTKCAALERVSFPAGLERIGECAFEYCEGLTRVSLPPALREIEKGAFAYCRNISELTFSGGPVFIGQSAFLHCEALTRAELPPLRAFAYGAFAYTGVAAFHIAGPGGDYRTVNGCILNDNGANLVCYPPQADPARCAIPASVTRVTDKSLYCLRAGCIEIPPSVVDFGFDERFENLHEFVYLLLSDPRQFRLLRCRSVIYLGPLTDLSVSLRSLCAGNYLRALAVASPRLLEFAGIYEDYIRAHADTYLCCAAESELLFRYFIEKNLLRETGVLWLMEQPEIAQNGEKKAMLLAYQNRWFPRGEDPFRLSLEDPALLRQARSRERRARVQGQKGVAGVVFVFSGKPLTPHLKERVKERGGVVRDTVSGNTDYVVAALPDAGTQKLRAAAAQEIPVISEETLLSMLEETN